MIFVDQSPFQNKASDWDERYCNRGMNSPAALASLQETLKLDPEKAHLGTINTCLGYRWQRTDNDFQTEATWKRDMDFFLAEAMKGNQEWFGKLMADHTALDWRNSIKVNFGSQANMSETQVLVVASSRSGCFPAAGPMQVVNYVNGPRGDRARGVVVDWGGHWCYWEKPELFNKLVLDFLDAKCTDMAELAVDKKVWSSYE
jgi:pimeloyl-ACP methyl ester carboxylesterase